MSRIFEVADAVAKLISTLSPIEQMQLVEHLSALICLRMNSKTSALMVADGFNKHIKQLIEEKLN